MAKPTYSPDDSLYDEQVPFPTTPEGWQEWRARPIPPRSTITRADYEALSPERRLLVDAQRLARFARHPAVDHPNLVEARQKALDLVRFNRYRQASTCMSLALDGDAFLGKSWATLAIAEAVEDQEWAANPGEWTRRGWRRQPVAVTTIRGDCTPSDLRRKLARALGIEPFGKGLDEAIINHIEKACVRLIVIDEISMLKPTRQRDARVLEMIKGYQNAVAVTFLANGTDLQLSGLFSAGDSRHHVNENQLGRRFDRYEFEPITSRGAFRMWLKLLEPEIHLLDAESGWLSSTKSELPAYILKRSGGVIGSAHALLEAAFSKVIGTPKELISVDLLKRCEIGGLGPDEGRDSDAAQKADSELAAARARPRKTSQRKQSPAVIPAGLPPAALGATLEELTLARLREMKNRTMGDATETPDPD